jgi:hypothetical protein
MRQILGGLTLALMATLAGPTLAADEVTDSMQAAYVPYRAALFNTNRQLQTESGQAVAQAQQAWKALGERFAAKPPAPYDRDAAFAEAVAKVSAVYERAAVLIRDGKLAEAHEALEAARDLMADLRRRNGVVTFSDHMNAYHAEMEHLLGAGPKMLGEPQGALRLMAQVGALDYLARRLREQAPAALAGNPKFDRLLKDVEGSVQGVKTALLGQDPQAVRSALGKIKPAYSKLFLEFG